MATSYRADQVGSLLRPPELLEARAAHGEGRVTLDQLRETEDAAILKVLEVQRQAGMDVLTDGEYRRGTFYSDLAEAVGGFVLKSGPLEWRGPGGGVAIIQRGVVGGKLRQKRRITAHETGFMKEHAPGPFKVTIPSPNFSAGASYIPGLTDQFYPTRSDLLRDLVSIVVGEVKAVADEGVPYIQIDEPSYTCYVDEGQRQEMRQAGIDLDRALEEAIAADNACLDGARREGVTLAVHLCRGNSRSQWISEGGYDPIAERLFSSLQVDRFLLEYDTERSGGFQPLRFVPKGKTVVLGLITTKEGRLEPQDELLRRIEEASKYVPLEYLAISPQCGFASVAAGNLLSWDEQRRKLELVAATARKVWG